jgi:hypothetical protein
MVNGTYRSENVMMQVMPFVMSLMIVKGILLCAFDCFHVITVSDARDKVGYWNYILNKYITLLK